MQQLTLADLGGAFVDAVPVADPESEMSADYGNLLLESVAQGSQTSSHTRGTFISTATAAPTTVDAANVSHRSHWGSAGATKPAVSKTATGLYTLTFPVSWTNGLDATETVSLFTGRVTPRSGDETDDLYAEVLTISANVVTVKVESPKATLADVGDSSTDPITIDWDFA
jgi:hypothetical protein